VNDSPTGSVTISGEAKQGQTLTVSNSLADLDGLGEISYQWLNNGKPIAGATQPTYILTTNDTSKDISVRASYVDLQNTSESVTSNNLLVAKADTSNTGSTTTPILPIKPTVNDFIVFLVGTDKADNLKGFTGNDSLTGRLGADKLTGGKGADIFKYTSVKDSGITAKTRDTITDFKHSEKDKIDLSAIDANEKLSGDQAFKFIGNTAFSKTDATGQLNFDSKMGVLYGSTNKDSAAEFSIQLSGVKSLVANDLIL
jgi:Ca2+-binding RTX toxin-like protein